MSDEEARARCNVHKPDHLAAVCPDCLHERVEDAVRATRKLIKSDKDKLRAVEIAEDAIKEMGILESFQKSWEYWQERKAELNAIKED